MYMPEGDMHQPPVGDVSVEHTEASLGVSTTVGGGGAPSTPAPSETQPQVPLVQKLRGFLARIRNTSLPSRTTLLETLRSRRTRALLVVMFLLVGSVLIVLLRDKNQLPLWMTYSGSYRLVPETISQSATIAISLPEEVGTVNQTNQITFTPQLRGEYVPSDKERVLYFKPSEPPTLGSHYNVALTYGSTTLGADFKVAEDPRVVSILPSDSAETHEDTNVSVMFNRPMVPLTTRDEMNKSEIPVTLSPDVPGVWKWKSTRLLQFIPETTLAPATRYTITVNEGFHSLDGVAVKSFTHTFTTRTLKQSSGLPPSVRFNEPLEIPFNQPIDLERTAEKIVLTQDGNPIEPIIEYAKKETSPRKFLGLVIRGNSDEVDTTKLWIRPTKDRHGREGFWDFESSYTLNIQEKYPAQGDITDTTPLSWSFSMPSILTSVHAVSQRTTHASPDFFDPQGELVVTFYEPIDINKTRIALTGVRSIHYGTECVKGDDGEWVQDIHTGECKKQENKREVRIQVEPGAYQPHQEAQIVFDTIVSEDGLVLNTKPVTWNVRSVPTLTVYRTIPEEGARGASLTQFTVCSNTPLHPPEKMGSAIQTDGPIVFPNNAMNNSYRVQEGWGSTPEEKCNAGEFHTDIRYGLHPERTYTITAHLTDDFGARTDITRRITTEPAPSKYTRFYSLHKWYNVTTPGKTRLTFAVENLTDITAHICKVAPATMLEILRGQTLSNSLPSASLCTEVRTATIDLPDTYWVNNYFYFDIKDYVDDVRGHYIITFTNPNLVLEDGRSGREQRYEHTLLSVSSITVGEKTIDWHDYAEGYGYEYESNTTASTRPSSALGDVKKKQAPSDLYWVLNAISLEPIFGATVTSYAGKQYPTYERAVAGPQATTNHDGVARTPSHADPIGATVTLGGDTAVVSHVTDTLLYQWRNSPEPRTYVYTDRPIYRPGDTVYLRGIDRVGYDNIWHVVPDYEARVSVSNSRGEVIYSQTLPVSVYGTFSTNFEIPKDAPLGGYSIQAMESGGYFDVEEYVGAPFKVTVTPRQDEYTAGDTAHIAVDSRYYFDMPVADAEVEYTVLAQDYYFDRYQDEYFNFGKGWYSCYWCGYGDTFITRGTVTLDADGKASVEVPLSFTDYFQKPEEEGSKLFTVIARVTDRSGKQVTGQNTIIVHRGQYYLGVKTDPYFSGTNQPVSVRIKSVDTQGKPMALNNITLSVTKVEWESYKRLEVDGGYYWHSEEKRTPVDSAIVDTDKEGSYSVNRTFTEPGSYEITATRADTSGNIIIGQVTTYVWGEGDVSVQPTNNETLTVTADKPSYATGDTATILVESPFKEGRALVTVERGDIYEYWTMPVSTAFIAKTIPLTPAYAPNVYASVLLVGPGPEVKYGNVELQSGNDTRELTIEVTPNKTAYVPGEEVELAVRTKNAKGEPVPAEVSVAIVDMSVLALKGNPKKDPVSFFYGTLALGVSTAHSAKNMLIQQDIPTGTKGGGGGEDLERRKRGTFKDTAYWQANVTTNDAGEATVRFTLPDNLTTWQIESLGVTTDTLIGVDYKEITSKKNVMAIPIRPRFVTPGDTLSVGMQIANNTGKDITVRAHIESPTLEIRDRAEEEVRVQAGEQTVVYFGVHAPENQEYGIHTVTFSAIGDAYQDVVEQSIPILHNQTFEVTATAGMTTDPYVFESVYVPTYALEGQGELTVRAQPTLVPSLLDAVREIAGYPYGCSEQIASKLASLAVTRRIGAMFGESYLAEVEKLVFNNETYSVDEAIKAGLTDLLGRQTYAGGFSFYAGTEPSLYLTVEVLHALTSLRDAGYSVPDTVFANSAQYITTELANMSYSPSHDLVARSAYALASPYVPVNYRSAIKARVDDIVNDPLALEQLGTTALGYLAIATYREPYTTAMAETTFGALENRLVIDARGAYVSDRMDTGYGWFEGPEKNTALLLDAVSDRGGDHPALNNMLRWLLVSKDNDGGWGSTNATFAVLDAVLRVAETRGEDRASYMLTLLKDGGEEATHTVTNDNLLNVFEHVFPLNSFARERLHTIALEKSNDAGKGSVYYDMQLRYALPPDLIPPRDEGITVERALYARDGTTPITEARVGDIVTGKLEITIPQVYNAVSIESFIPAGFEIVNYSFATEESRDLAYDAEGNYQGETYDDYGYYDAGYEEPYSIEDPTPELPTFPVSYQETHDDRVFAFTEQVQPGTYTFEYTLRALVPGTYNHMPTTVRELYTPEVFGRTEAGTFTIVED